MLKDDLYAELGFSNTKLNGKNIGDIYKIASETTKQGYLELAKRIKTDIGTIDISINTGKSFYEFKNDEKSHGLAIDYYPSNNTKFSISKQFETGNNTYNLGIKHNSWFVNYGRNTSNDTKNIELGLSFAFDNAFDFSTYSTKQSIGHLSELHRFENIVLRDNMSIQSSKGIKHILPTINISITTSGPVITGANSDVIVADNGPSAPINIALSVNNPYILSANSITFNTIFVDGTVETKTVNVLNNGVVVGTKSIQVTWQ